MNERARLVLLCSFFALSMPGCFGPIDLTGRMCPCDDGWTCDARNRCVRDGSDTGDMDVGGMDVGRSDTGPRDTGPGPDVPALDAPGLDVGDAGGMDGGTSDVPRDVPMDAPPALELCPPGARLCDDFESLVLDRVPPWDWNVGPPSRMTDQAHGGDASGFFSLPGGPLPGEHSIGIDTDTATTEVWVRIWAYVPSSVVDVDMGVIALGGGAPDYTNTSLLAQSGGWGFYSTVSSTYRGGVPMVRDGWDCVRFHVVLGTPGRIELFAGGDSRSADVDTAFAVGVRVIGAGITYVDPMRTLASSIYLDDVTITLDGTALACP